MPWALGLSLSLILSFGGSFRGKIIDHWENQHDTYKKKIQPQIIIKWPQSKNNDACKELPLRCHIHHLLPNSDKNMKNEKTCTLEKNFSPGIDLGTYNNLWLWTKHENSHGALSVRLDIREKHFYGTKTKIHLKSHKSTKFHHIILPSPQKLPKIIEKISIKGPCANKKFEVSDLWASQLLKPHKWSYHKHHTEKDARMPIGVLEYNLTSLNEWILYGHAQVEKKGYESWFSPNNTVETQFQRVLQSKISYKPWAKSISNSKTSSFMFIKNPNDETSPWNPQPPRVSLRVKPELHNNFPLIVDFKKDYPLHKQRFLAIWAKAVGIEQIYAILSNRNTGKPCVHLLVNNDDPEVRLYVARLNNEKPHVNSSHLWSGLWIEPQAMRTVSIDISALVTIAEAS